MIDLEELKRLATAALPLPNGELHDIQVHVDFVKAASPEVVLNLIEIYEDHQRALRGQNSWNLYID